MIVRVIRIIGTVRGGAGSLLRGLSRGFLGWRTGSSSRGRRLFFEF